MNELDLEVRYPGFRLEARARWDAPCAALFGASGSGKSTILEALLGLRPEVRGSCTLAGERLDGKPTHERGLGWVPQDASLFPHWSVRRNIDFASASPAGERRAREAVAALEIGPLLDRAAHELSGGERSRVAIARALARDPRMLLLDEPLASLDRPLRGRIVPFLDALARGGTPLVVVTHDPLEVLALAQVVFVLERGRIVESGPPREVFASAASFGASLGAENRFAVTVLERSAGTARVRTAGGLELTLVRVEGFDDPREIAVRAEDVVIMTARPEGVSAQNVFEATVRGLEPSGPQLVVLLGADGGADEGEVWRVKVTREAVRSLGLEPGRRVVCLVKAHSVVGV